MRTLLTISLSLFMLCTSVQAEPLRTISQAGRLLQPLSDASADTAATTPTDTLQTEILYYPRERVEEDNTTAERGYRFKAEKEYRPKIAIIIDDIGNNVHHGRRTAQLPGNLTLAVLPKTPGAEIVAREGHASGKQIMLHAPMSNHNAMRLGPGGLTEDMDKETFVRTLNESIDAIPHITGVNNHMGSLLTTHKQQMEWVMETLQQRQLFFVDSLTNSKSVAYRTAKKYGLNTQKRDIFLDHFRDEESIEKAYRALLRKAELNGYAIGIGHPYPSTLNVLERLLPELEARNIELVHVSELLQINRNQQLTSLSE